MVLSRVVALILFLSFTSGWYSQMDSVLVKTVGAEYEDVFNDLIIVDDTLFVVGSSAVCNNEDGVVVKFDTNLNVVSTVRIGSDVPVEKFNTVDVYNDTLILAGLTNENASYEVKVVKMDKSLNVVDEVVLNMGNWTFCDQIKINSEGKIIGVGKVLGQYGDWDASIFCLNWDLEVEWTFVAGDSQNDEYHDLVLWNDSTIVATGFWTNEVAGDKDLLLSRIDIHGNLDWHSKLGESADDWAESIIRTQDSSLAMFGTTSSYTSVSEDTYLVKADSNGNFLWSNLHQVQTPDNTMEDNGIELLQMANGTYFVFSNLRSFVVPGVYNGGIFQTDANGNWMGTQHISGFSDDVIRDVLYYNDSSVFLCGYTESYGFGGKEGFVGKLSYIGSNVSFLSEEQHYNCFSNVEQDVESVFEVHPNPFANQLTISLPNSFQNYHLKMYNVSGKLVLQTLLDQEINLIDTPSVLGKGLYLVVLEAENGEVIRFKMIHE